MKKILYVTCSFLLFYNLCNAQKVKRRFSYDELNEICSKLTKGNNVAFYAIKKPFKTKLSYAIFKQSTNEVIYYNGKSISNSEFLKLKLKLNKKVLFKNGAVQLTGAAAANRGSQGEGYIFLNAKIVFDEANNDYKKKYFYEIYLNEFHKIKARIVDKDGTIIEEDGGGPGETVVSKPPGSK
jgi:hypothetical protein